MASVKNKWNHSQRRLLGQSNKKQGHKQSFDCTENTQRKFSPFIGNSYLERFKDLITAYIGSSKAVKNATATENIELEIADIACKIIFTTPVTQLEDVRSLVSNYFRLVLMTPVTTKDKENPIDQVLITVFIKKLSERFMYKKRLQDMVKERQIPVEKKQKWLQYQYEVQGRLLKETDPRSVTFLKELFQQRKPLLVYQVLEALLKLPNGEDVLYTFLNSVLTSIKAYSYYSSKKELSEHFQTIRKLAEESSTIPQKTKILFTEHWNKNYEKIQTGLQFRHERANNVRLRFQELLTQRRENAIKPP